MADEPKPLPIKPKREDDPETAFGKDIVRRFPIAAQPLLDLFDECLQHGMILQFDQLVYNPMLARHIFVSPRVVKVVA